MKFRKKPVVIEAFKFGEDELPEWIKNCEKISVDMAPDIYGKVRPFRLTISTLEGDMVANEGDYIIKGVKGELYPCKPDIFEETYEKVEE